MHEKFEASGRAADQAVVVPDALLLFGGDYKKSGNDLILSKDGREFTAPDYFKAGKRADLTTSDGAVLSSKIVEALTGHVQYAQATAADPPKVIGQVSKLSGTATAIRNGVSVELNVGANVLKGDILQSGGGSSVTVTFVDGTVFGLGANARMALTEMVYDPNSSSNSSLLSLIQGTITFVAGETAKRGDMRVETPVATMGIRGTAVLVEIGFQITSATAPPVNFQVLVEPNGTTGSFVLYSRSNPNQIIGTVNQAGVVTAVTAAGNVNVAAAPPLPPEAAAIIQQTLQTYFPTYVPPTDPNANPNAPGNNNNNNNNPPSDPNRAPDQGTPTNRTDNPNPQSPTRAASSAPPPTANTNPGTVLSPTASPSLVIETGETVTRPVTIVDAAGGAGSTGTTAPITRTVEVTITRFNSAPVIEVHDVQNAQQFRIGDQVTITDADAADPAFNDVATPYVANTAVVTSVEAPATAPSQTELLSLVSIDQTTGAVSYDPRQFAFLGPNQAITYNISFQSRSGPDTVSQSLRLTVNGVNDAPDLTEVALEVGEGQTVILTAENIGVTDPDSTQFTFSVSEVSHGTVQRLSNGGIWQNVTSFTSADLAAGHVRFVHDGSEVAPSFRISVSDGSANGVPVLADITFSNQNDAPQLEPQSPVLATISVAETANHGQQVADIVAGSISDPDANALQGIAITGADVSSTNGTWQFSLDGGATWTNFGTYSSSSALLLASTDLVRFVPDGTATGTPSFTFFAWDQTSGVHGTVADASVRGGGGALSEQSDTAVLTVTERVGITVTGDGGANDLAGGEFADTLIGLGGNDRLVGYQGGDLLDGGAGRDTADYHYFRYDQATQTVLPVNSDVSLPPPTSGINVSLAQGIVIGDATVGTDTLRSVEYVRGTHLDDSFDATGFGTGSLNSSSVNNLFNNGFEGYEGNDTIVGNGGTQLIYTHAEAGVTVDLAAGTAQGTAPGDAANVGADTFAGVGAVRGSEYDDTLLGSNSTSRTDIFNGGAGNDLIDGRGGYDLAVYSSALDNFVTSGVQINLALGTVVATNPQDTSVGSDTLRSVEAVRGTTFDDTFDATGFGGSSVNAGSSGTFNEFEGVGGNDLVIGNGNTRLSFNNALAGVTADIGIGTAQSTDANDAAGVGVDTFSGVNSLRGSNFDDRLLSSSNPSGTNESFYGGSGNDFIDGRGGFDRALYSFTSDDPGTGGINVTMASGIVSGDASVGTDTLRGIEAIRGTNFNDVYDATGFGGSSLNAGAFGTFNEIEGMAGNDTIIGNSNTRIAFYNATSNNGVTGVTVNLAAGTASGNSSVGTDTIVGGVNAVYGSVFADTITGAAGSETFTGSGGNDTIDGGGATAADLAVYLGASTEYTITQLGPNQYRVQDNVANRDGTDVVTNVEVLQFTDRALLLSSGSLASPVNISGISLTTTTPLVSTTGNVDDFVAVGSNIFGHQIDLGAGTGDTVSLAATGGYTLSLLNVENVRGTSGDDFVQLSANANGLAVDLGGGNDSLNLAIGTNSIAVQNVEQIGSSDFSGTASDDSLTLLNTVSGVTINLGLGSNTLTLAAGTNVFSGYGLSAIYGSGSADFLTVTNGLPNTAVDLGGGNDTLNVTSSFMSVALSNVEHVVGDTQNNAVTIQNVQNGLTIDLGTGIDNLALANGTNTLSVSNVEQISGADFIGAASDDTLTLNNNVSGLSVNLQQGTNTLNLAAGVNGLVDVFVQRINGSGGDDALTVSGNVFDATIDLGSGTDSLTLGNPTGSSVIVRDVETVTGGAGADNITITHAGPSGTTTVTAGLGNDSITASAQSDVIRYTSAAESSAIGLQDQVFAFDASQDVFRFSGMYGVPNGFAGQIHFIGSANFSGGGSEARLNGNILQIDVDGNGFGANDIQLSVTFSSPATLTDSNFVVDNAPTQPVVGPTDNDAGANTVTEGAATGTPVGVTALATDADVGATISYSLSDNAGGRFAINATTGVVTVANGTLLDYETATSHNITVLATSSDGATGSQTFTINVTNVNDNPVAGPTDANGTANTVAEGAAAGTLVGITALASDADAGATISYSLSDNAGSRFAIDASTGIVTVSNGTLLDSEAATSHNITVLATSSDGSVNSQTFSVSVTNVNDNPVVGPTDNNAAANTVAEGAANGTLVGITALATDADVGATVSYSLSDNAGGRFAINASTGVVMVADGSLLDFEVATSHGITVLATSSDGSSNSQTFTVSVTNAGDNPVVGPTDNDAGANTVAEGAATGTLVGIMALATDADAGTAISYSLSDNAGGRFAINATTGVVTVANGALLDYEGATSHNITVLATSSDGSSNSQTFTVSVTNVNDGPVVGPTDNNAGANTVAEGAANGTPVGITALATDADAGATVSYALSDNAGGRFAINATTGVVTVANGTLLDYETATSHNITVLATSSDGSSNSQTFTIGVTNVSDNPVVGPTDNNAAANTVAEGAANGTLVGITALATDADAGATVSYALSDNAGGRFAINAATGVVTVANGTLLDYETATSHNITVLATSSDGSSNSQTFTVSVTNVNDGPVVGPTDNNAGANMVAEGAANGTPVGITALATDADAGATISYSLSDNAGGRFAINATTGVVTVANGTLLDYETATSHNITVLATSSDGSSNSQTFTIGVTNVNDNPVVGPTDNNAAANTVAEGAANGTLVGITALATDADAGATTNYSLSDDAGGRFAINATTGAVTVANGTLLDFEAATSHNITVLATSSDGSSNSQTFTINVTNASDNPVVGPTDNDAGANTVAEGAASGTLVGITALATDADVGTTISYSLSDNAGGRFAINAATGVVTVANGTLLDYETATSHNIAVLATSSDGSSNSQTFTVNVSNVNDNPVAGPTDANGATNTVAEGAANGMLVGITALATDADAGATVSYALSDSAGGRFAINATTGVVTVANGTLLDYETATSHNITVLATSSDGSSSSQTFTIGVTNVNDNPVVGPTDNNAAANTVAEGAANGTLVGITALATDADAGATVSYSLSDNAGGRFAINAATGVVAVANGTLLDYETATSYSITVLATSSDGSSNSQTFTVNVTNVNDNPVAGPTDNNAATNTVAEGAATGTLVGIAALATDADAGTTISYSLSDNAGGRFAINATTGVVAVANGTLLDYETATSHNITVLATSSDGSSNSQTFTIGVTNVNDNPVVGPTDANGAANTVAENAANGTLVGITAQATDADIGATISYALSDNAGGRFAINASTGVVTVANGALLDYETATSHSITVLATSSDGSSNSQTFTVNVTNAGDNPVVGPMDNDAGANAVVENAANGVLVGITALATDADAGTTISYSLTDNAGGRFTINASTGVVAVANGALLDYETATTHNITVLATSSDGSSNSQTFTVALIDEDNQVNGTSGADTFQNTASEDTFSGAGASDLVVYSNATAGITVDLDAGIVTGDAAFHRDILRSVEQVRGTAFADLFDATGFTTTSANASSIATSGRFSSLVTNTFEGEGGNDQIIGNGNTAISYRHATGGVIVDLQAGTASGDASVGSDTFSGVNSVRGSEFNDTLSGRADSTRIDIFTPGAGNDTVDGRAGYDLVIFNTDTAGLVHGVNVNLTAGTATDLFTTDPLDTVAAIGNDTLTSIESVRGTNFNDRFIATGFNSGSLGTYNEFEGLGGNDEITGNGNTTLIYGNTAASADGTSGVTVDLRDGIADGETIGHDTFSGANGVVGSDYNDFLYGSDTTATTEIFSSRGGDDWIDGRGGFDRALYSSTIQDRGANGVVINLAAGTVAGGATYGNDTLRGIEAVRGSNFNDTYDATGFGLNSQNANIGSFGTFNEFEGMDGDDTIVSNGNTRIAFYNALAGVTVDLQAGSAVSSEAVNDPLSDNAAIGRDTITGVNQIVGSGFGDTLLGSNNTATFSFEEFDGRGGNDTFNGRGGFDRAIYNNDGSITSGLGINVDMAAGTVTSSQTAIGNDTLISIEAIRGTNRDDTYTATGYSSGSFGTFNEFEGMGGNDVVTGNGNTRLVFYNAGAAVTVDIAAGTASGATIGNDTFTGVNAVRGSSANDTLRGSDNANGTTETFVGRGGNDTIEGRGGFDQVLYNTDSTTFSGVEINMTLGRVRSVNLANPDGSIGVDTLRGIEQVVGTNFADVYHAEDTAEAGDEGGFGASGQDASTHNVGSFGTFNAFDGAGGNDTITGNGNTQIMYSSATAGVTVTLANGAGTATGDGSVGMDTITGGVNNVYGSSFNDTFTGGATSETFTGAGGDDSINGGGTTAADLATFRGLRAEYTIQPHPTISGSYVVTDTVTGRDGTDTLTNVELLQFTDVTLLLPAATAVDVSQIFFNGPLLSYTGTNDDHLIIGQNLFNRSIDLGSGVDTIGLAAGGSYGLNIVNVENIAGSGGDDFVSVVNNVNLANYPNGLSIDLGAGNDSLNLANGSNVLGGVVNVEQINGSDFAVGQASNDVLTFSSAVSGVSINLGNGSNTLNLAAGTNSFVNLGNVNFLNGTDSADVLTIDNGPYAANNNPALNLGLGSDTLNIGSQFGQFNLIGVEQLNGNALENNFTLAGLVNGLTIDLGVGVNDTLNLASGTNTIGLAGVERVNGSDFGVATPVNDTLNLSNAVSGVTIHLGNGTNTLNLAGGASSFNELWVQNVNGTTSDETVTIAGQFYAGITIDLGDGVDTVNLSNSAPNFVTVRNVELVNGSGGNDNIVIANVDGDTVVAGGLGSDTITASAGHDVIRYSAAAQSGFGGTHDQIIGFNASADQFAFTGMYGVSGGFVSTISFIGSGTFSGLRSEARLNGNYLQIDVNGDGNLDANDMEIELVGLTGTLTNSNFIVSLVTGDGAANTLNGTSASDAMFGFAGNDTFNAGDGANDTVDYRTATSGISVNLASGVVTGDASVGTDTLVSIEIVRGTEYADTYDATGFWTGAGATSTNLGSPSLAGGVNNAFQGMDGNDTITGNGRTTASYQTATAGVTVNLSSFTTGGSPVAINGSAFSTAGGNVASVGTDTLINVFWVRGSEYADVLNGGVRNDVFTGGGGNDAINGAGGFDLAIYAPGTFDNTTGGVNIDMASGVVTGDASIGTDTLRSVESVRGTIWNDTYVATNFGASGFLNTSVNNVGNFGTFNEFEGMGGNDLITGNGNTRITYASAGGAVTVNLEAHSATGDLSVGTDTLAGIIAQVRGSSFNDTLIGSNSNGTNNYVEEFDGWAGNDFINGGDGFDQVTYANNSVTTAGINVNMTTGVVIGDSSIGTDTLRSIEQVYGTAFSDTYNATAFGASGLDPLTNNVGNNGTFNSFQGNGGNDTITGNGNTRIVYFSATAGVTVDLAAGTATGDASVGTDTIVSGVASVAGSAFVDNLLGSDNLAAFTAEEFDGRAGNDILNGRGGFDRAVYNADASVTSGITVNMAAGTVDGGTNIDHDTLLSIEAVRGTNFNDSYTATGFGSSSTNAGSNGTFNEFEGMGGNDTMVGNGNTRLSFVNSSASVVVSILNGTATGATIGNDTFSGVNAIRGSNFADDISGGDNASGTEVFDGRRGNDTINGNGGFDQATYFNDSGITSGVTVNMGAGTVTGDASVGTDTLRSIEQVYGTNFNDTYDASTFGSGGALNIGNNGTFNSFQGNGGNDTVIGNGNTQIVFSNATAGVNVDLAAGTVSGDSSVGSDTVSGISNVSGSNFNDAIAGGNANETLNGGTGNDIINGDAGNDTLTGGGGQDQFIFDANHGQDVITDFATSLVPNSDVIELIYESGAMDFTTWLNTYVEDSVNGATIYSDANHALAGQATILLQGIARSQLTQNDFIFGPSV